MDNAHKIAIKIINEFEELLDANDIKIPDIDREGYPEEACLFGNAYYELEEKISRIIVQEIKDMLEGGIK